MKSDMESQIGNDFRSAISHQKNKIFHSITFHIAISQCTTVHVDGKIFCRDTKLWNIAHHFEMHPEIMQFVVIINIVAHRDIIAPSFTDW